MSAAITASTQSAADAGAEILRAGGNAMDAAVAAALATGVADPCNLGIGGYGGFLVVHDAAQPARARSVQFPLCAPQDIAPASLARPYPEEGPECSSVPGVVAGLARALREFGSLSWERVSVPAIRLARDGVAANALTRRAFEQNRHRRFMDECFVIEADGPRGWVFRQPALAATLEELAVQGPEWFYAGPLGEAACAAWKGAGVPVTLEEWRRQPEAAETVDASSFEVSGVRLFAPTLGLSGSACTFATYAAAERVGADGLATSEGLAELAMAMARIWRYRFTAGGANDFSGVDIARWIDAALAGEGGAARLQHEPAHTAHVNASDGRGMVVALTATQGHAWFGGRWSIPGSGVIMNCGMHNFTVPALVRRAGRWMGVSNMSPTIARDAAGHRVAVGCPGARLIPSNVALVLARHLLLKMPLQAAVSAARLHAEEADRVGFEEDRAGPPLVAALGRRFAGVEPHSVDDYYGPLTALRAAASGAVETAVDDRVATGYAAHA
jgi:gamma-glutamyltranspeptidase/glutathione hydrolase